MSISDKITRLSTARDNISSAITNKGGTVSVGDGFEDFASDIATIPSGETHPRYTYTGTNMSFAKQCCEWAETLGITGTKLLLLDSSTTTAGNNRCVCLMFVNGAGVSLNRFSLVAGDMTFSLRGGITWTLTDTTGCNILSGTEFIEYDISEIFGE